MDGEDLLRMNPREIKRLHLIRQALEEKISQKEAAEVAGLSARQMRRLMKRVEAEGDRGIVHRRRGKPSNRRIADKTKQKVLALFEKHYPDYGPTLASEKLEERHRIGIHPETLRLWLRQARLPYKQRKGRPHRQWRQRRRCFGEMVQMDGSHHDWLEGRGPKLVLMGYIDDSTSINQEIRSIKNTSFLQNQTMGIFICQLIVGSTSNHFCFYFIYGGVVDCRSHSTRRININISAV